MRGNPSSCNGGSRPERSIPASAGQPYPEPLGLGLVQVYPRECGATRCRFEPCRPCHGLSPRVRGNRDVVNVAREIQRSIPASAGQPQHIDRINEAERVYPRECGATDGSSGHCQPRNGLSPRVRGNRRMGDLDGYSVGSIPASAGQPATTRSTEPPCPVYPRECGATQPKALIFWYDIGLSPRVRGNR